VLSYGCDGAVTEAAPAVVVFVVYRTHVAGGVHEGHDRGVQEGGISCPLAAMGMMPEGAVKSQLAGCSNGFVILL
jgi:hypothetical protein